MSITKKLDSVYGQRQPSLVESEDKLEDVVDKIPGINKVVIVSVTEPMHLTFL